MEDVIRLLQRNAQDYWRSAVEPFHHFGWQTLSLIAIMILSTLLLVTSLLHYSWVLSKPAVRGARIEKKPHSTSRCLRLSPEDHMSFHGVKATAMSDTARELRTSDDGKYYVVSIVQTKPVRELIYREMRLQAPPVGMAHVSQGFVQLDSHDLSEVRRKNSFTADNDPNAEVEGTYDIYIRPVRWLDIRHWLMHPMREVRIVVWVTLITTTVPTLIQVLFG